MNTITGYDIYTDECGEKKYNNDNVVVHIIDYRGVGNRVYIQDELEF